MSALPYDNRRTGIEIDGLNSVASPYNIPYIAPGWNNSQYSGLILPEDPFLTWGGFEVIKEEAAKEEAAKPAFVAIAAIGVFLFLILFK